MPGSVNMPTRRITIRIDETGGAEPPANADTEPEPGFWHLSAEVSRDLTTVPMETLNATALVALEHTLANYRKERGRGRQRHGYLLLP